MSPRWSIVRVVVLIMSEGLLTSDVRAYVGHLKERCYVLPVDVHGLLPVAAGVDEHFQGPGSAAEVCEWSSSSEIETLHALINGATTQKLHVHFCFLDTGL